MGPLANREAIATSCLFFSGNEGHSAVEYRHKTLPKKKKTVKSKCSKLLGELDPGFGKLGIFTKQIVVSEVKIGQPT